VTVAKDVKIQVEFNPAHAAAYRLIGYENRLLRKEDFHDDAKDAGDIGAGHTVTALYEVVPPGSPIQTAKVDTLKYQAPAGALQSVSPELFTVKLRYKAPDGTNSTLMTLPFTDTGSRLETASVDFKFVAAVAAFGMILRDSEHKGTATLPMVRQLATPGTNDAHRAEFIELVAAVDRLGTRTAAMR
jgi:Ca-activated chloride channel family protein